ncbi:MAG TPA: hypothetical protein PLD59_15165 [Tepidisphaeraceae bacterium]|nr:hypothetical protein [Tepidisphaeraceae bacterium]
MATEPVEDWLCHWEKEMSPHDAQPILDPLAQLGVAGLMGAMWLWERRTSQKREQQIDEAHTRIITDRVLLEELIEVVKQNAAAMTDLSATQRQLIAEIKRGEA